MNQPFPAATQARQPASAQPRIAVLVLGCLLPVYDRCIGTIRATLGSRRRDGVDVFYVYGGQGTHADSGLVRSLPAAGVYHGPLSVYAPSGYPFVSGASMLLSRDVAAGLADSAQAIVAGNVDARPDDVAIGHWIADTYCPGSVAEIRRRIAAGRKATDNETFVLPYGRGLVNFVHAPTQSQVPQPQAYHYHFHSGRIGEMEEFHHRFFAA
jgi:hypothetical protein